MMKGEHWVQIENRDRAPCIKLHLKNQLSAIQKQTLFNYNVFNWYDMDERCELSADNQVM